MHEPSGQTRSKPEHESRGMPTLNDRREQETHIADLPSYPDADTDHDTGERPGHGSTQSAPRWVFVIAIVVVLLMVVLHLTGILGPGLH